MNKQGIASDTLQTSTNDMFHHRRGLRLTKQEHTLIDILENKNNTTKLRCIFSHWGIKRNLSDTGTVSFVGQLYAKGDIIPRNEIVIRNIDNWLVNNPLKSTNHGVS